MVSTCSRILHCRFWAFQSSFSLIADQFVPSSDALADTGRIWFDIQVRRGSREHVNMEKW